MSKKKKVDITRRFLKNDISVRMTGGSESEDTETSIVEEYAAVFNSWSQDLDWFREKVMPNAFNVALERSDARALLNHDANHLLGREKSGTLTLSIDEIGLRYSLVLPHHRHDIVELIDRGDLAENSFAFRIAKDEWIDHPDGTTDRIVHEIETIVDISLVTYPAYLDTSLALRSYTQHKEEVEAPDTYQQFKKDSRSRTLSLARSSMTL